MRSQLYHRHVNAIALLFSSGGLSTTRTQHLYEIGVTHQADKNRTWDRTTNRTRCYF